MRSIVCLSGTSRPDNYTAMALAVVESTLRETCEVVHFDARDMQLAFPGQPPTDDSAALLEAVTSASGVVFATPEYHGSFSAMTKLIIENLGFPSALKGKAVGLVGVAAGRIGAIKSLEHLRAVCAHTGAMVAPFSVSVAGVRNAFAADGAVIDQEIAESLVSFASGFTQFIGDYICPKYILENSARQDGKPWSSIA